MPKLNKYETQRILLNESKVKRLKFQLKLCNLHFPLISLLLTLKTWSSVVSQRLNSPNIYSIMLLTYCFPWKRNPLVMEVDPYNEQTSAS